MIKQEFMKELIVCAAIKFNKRNQKDINLNRKGVEVIIPMVRHYSIDGRDVLEAIQPYTEECEIKEISRGFITNFSRYVDRKEALKIAKENNQIRNSIGYEPDELYIEMLY